MSTIPAPGATLPMHLQDEAVVQQVLGGETALYEILMRRYNQRLYRIARAILRNDAEAEDVMQDAYVRAYQHLRQFAGKSSFATWLTRIAIHEALARKRRRGRMEELDALPLNGESMSILQSPGPSPEDGTARSQMRELLEHAIERLPETYRTVVVMREVEEMSVAETAAGLGLTEAVVKTRLHRAHAMLRKEIYSRTKGKASELYQFQAPRCDRVVRNVFARILAARQRDSETVN